MAFTEFWLKAFERGDLMLIELERAFASMLFEVQKALVIVLRALSKIRQKIGYNT